MWLIKNKIILVITILIIILGIYLLYKKYWKKDTLVENYGGPNKNVKKLPKGVCHNICKQYYDNCMISPTIMRSGDYGYCDRIKQICDAECHYSNYQRT